MANRADETKLREAAEHLLYEVRMFKAASRKLLVEQTQESKTQEIADDEKVLIHNAVLESFGIHFRVITDFLYRKENKRKMENDIKAFHYLPSHAAVEAMGDSVWCNHFDKWVSKRIAHLTYYRLEKRLKEEGWPIIRMGDGLRDALLRFLAAANSEMVSKVYEECNGDWYQGLRPLGGDTTVVTTSTAFATTLINKWPVDEKRKKSDRD